MEIIVILNVQNIIISSILDKTKRKLIQKHNTIQINQKKARSNAPVLREKLLITDYGIRAWPLIVQVGEFVTTAPRA